MVDLFEREYSDPWHHFEFGNILPNSILDRLKRVPSRLFRIYHTPADERIGNYDEKNLRYFVINTGFSDLISIFTDNQLSKKMQDVYNRDLKYVRFTLMEVFGQRKPFLHCDDPEKLVTVQIFLTNKNKKHFGTWYYKDRTLAKKLPYNDNCGHMFAPIQNVTWHSIPEIKEDNICRRSLLVNYVNTPTEWHL